MPPSDPASPKRQRTVSWQDPSLAAEALGEMTGLEWLGAIADGRLPRPPIGELVGYRLKEFEAGRAVFVLSPGEWLYNPLGMVHGGALTTALDTAMGAAIHTMLERGAAYSTLELKVNFVAPVSKSSGALRAEGKVIHLGKRTATAEGRLTDDQGDLCAHSTATCMVFRPKKLVK